MKSDGYPTYNFCHIIDDMLMEITHVFRSQEFISSTPKFLNLYEALNIERPVLATLPYVMAIDGKKKLSKRDGAKDILGYADDGYLPETMLNFLVTLGWNDGTEQEVFTINELIEKFDISRIQKSPARFDEKRLLWLNGQHIRLLPLDELMSRVENFWPQSATNASDTDKRKVLALVQDRLKTLADLPILTSYFFEEPDPDWNMVNDNKQLKKLTIEQRRTILTAARDALYDTSVVYEPEALQDILNTLLEATGEKPGVLLSLIRLSISWAPFSPALPDTIAALGRDTTVARIDRALDALAE